MQQPGAVDHNYWKRDPQRNQQGSSLASSGKESPRSVLLSTSGAGVEAVRQTVRIHDGAFNNKIGCVIQRHGDFDVIIVNHGQGGSINVPFYQKERVHQACSTLRCVSADDAFALNPTLC